MNFKLSATLAAIACAALPASAAVSDFTVNGRTISAATQEHYIQAAAAQGLQRNPELERSIREGLANQEVLVQEAERQKLTDDKDTALRLKEARDSILANEVIMKYLKANPVTESELKAAYDKEKASYGPSEYHVRHILVKTKAEANKVISRIKSGEDFGKVAKEVSIDEGTKANGGDLDWTSPSSMVPPFAEAMKSQKVGAVSASPVQSQFGFHVLQVIAKRPAELFPSYEHVKPEIRKQLTAQKRKAYIDSLVKKAVIK